MSGKNLRVGFVFLSALFPFSGAAAQETVVYTYDARGRVVAVAKAGGPADGVQASYAYDQAGNRTNVTVTNAPNGNSGGDPNGGASVPPENPVYVVVPLNGYTLIRVQ